MFEDKVNFVVEVGHRLCSNHKIVHVDYQPLFTYVVGEIVVHERLEGWG